MNGVMIPEVSAGSNHVGASDMRGIDELAVRRPGRFRAGGQDTESSKTQQVATRRACGRTLGYGIVVVASR